MWMGNYLLKESLLMPFLHLSLPGEADENAADAGETDEEKMGDEFVVEIPRIA